MSFRGRSFRPRSFTGPPRSSWGLRGSYRFSSYVPSAASSSHGDSLGNERTSFEERDRFHRTRSPDNELDVRSGAREHADKPGPYRGGNSSYYSHRTSTIDYGHQGMKTISSTGAEVDQPSKMVAVEKAMEMAQRTRDIISKLGGAKQMSHHSKDSSSFTDSAVQPSAGFCHPDTWSSETNTITAKSSADSAAINKIRQNTSLVQYAFNLPIESEQSTFETPIPDRSREAANYAVTSVTASARYEDNSAVYSQQNAWNMAPKVAPEPEKTDSCDPTIANILKSIGFNFELSNMMQDKACKDYSDPSSVGQNSTAASSLHTNRVPSLYEEKAHRYRAEQMRQSETQKPDIEEPSPVDFKLKFKTSDAKAGEKPSTLYEDFSDSDDDFTATAKMETNVENKSIPGTVSQNIPNTPAFGNEGMLPQVTANKTADDLDWELSTEVFIRKLQQPRQAQRTVTVVPQSEPTGRNVSVPALQSERADSDALEIQSDNFKLDKSFVPLEELKTIRKTIIVSESPVKTDSSMGKSDSSNKNVRSSANSTNREKTPKFQQRSEALSKSTEKAIIDSRDKKIRGSDPDDRNRQRRIDALRRELENLKRQQNILMRRRKREKDAHKDPILMENSKLQEEICSQIDKLRAASLQAEDNSRNQASDRSKDETESDRHSHESDRRSQSRSVRRSSRSMSPDGRDNRQYRSKSTAHNTDTTSDRQPRIKRIDVNYEYFDGGNHFCRCCTCFSVNIFEHCQHLISSAHQQNVDPFDKPWLKLAVKAPAKPAVPKGKPTSARIRGVEFLMTTQAFYCSLCDVFLGSCTCAETHCKSDEHNDKYAKYLDENPYYERRLELEKSSSSAVTGKPLPASMQLQTSASYSRGKNEVLAAAVEKAKKQVQQMVKKRNHEEANIDYEPLYPTYKKSRVVPKSSGVLTENVSNRRLEDDNAGTEVDSKKSDSSATDLDDVSRHVSTSAEGVTSLAESQKNEAETPETNKAKKSLPFIGKLPFLKAARAAKQAASEQSAADDKSKIEIKLNVSHTVSTPVQSEPTLSSSDAVGTSAQEQAVPELSVSVPMSNVESSSMGEQNSLDAFLSIGDPESEQSQAVPVLNVGPQTRSEFMLENQLNGAETSPVATEATNSLAPACKDAEFAVSAASSLSAVQSGIDVASVLGPSADVTVTIIDEVIGDGVDVASVPGQSADVKLTIIDEVMGDGMDIASTPSPSADVKLTIIDEVMGDTELSGVEPTSNSSNKSQSDDVSLSSTSASVVQTHNMQILPISDTDNVNSSGILAAADTVCNTDPSHMVKECENTSKVSLEADDNTEDYEPEDNAETEQVAKLRRDEEIAQLLPQTSAMWMQPADSVKNDCDEDEEAAVMSDEYEFLDECGADD